MAITYANVNNKLEKTDDTPKKSYRALRDIQTDIDYQNQVKDGIVARLSDLQTEYDLAVSLGITL